MNRKLLPFLIIFSLIYISFPALSANSQKKNAENAKRLIGKPDKYSEAKALIESVLKDSLESRNAENWYISGTLDWDSFEADMRKLSINPADKSVSASAMAKKVYDGFNAFTTALSLDTLPNSKGKVKPRFEKKIYPRISNSLPYLYTSAHRFYADGNYWPLAYQAFKLCTDLPDANFHYRGMMPLNDSLRSTSAFFAGVSAYQTKHYREAYDAFTLASRLGRDDDTVLTYRIACLEAGIDSAEKNYETRKLIATLAEDGFKRFGHLRFGFLDSAVESLHAIGEDKEALRIITEAEANNPLKPSILALKAWMLSETGETDKAMDLYLSEPILASPYPAILLEGASKVYRKGKEKYASAKGRSAAAKKAREEARRVFIEHSLLLAQQALEAARKQGDKELEDKASEMIAAIQYSLDSLI